MYFFIIQNKIWRWIFFKSSANTWTERKLYQKHDLKNLCISSIRLVSISILCFSFGQIKYSYKDWRIFNIDVFLKPITVNPSILITFQTKSMYKKRSQNTQNPKHRKLAILWDNILFGVGPTTIFLWDFHTIKPTLYDGLTQKSRYISLSFRFCASEMHRNPFIRKTFMQKIFLCVSLCILKKFSLLLNFVSYAELT